MKTVQYEMSCSNIQCKKRFKYSCNPRSTNAIACRCPFCNKMGMNKIVSVIGDNHAHTTNPKSP